MKKTAVATRKNMLFVHTYSCIAAHCPGIRFFLEFCKTFYVTTTTRRGAAKTRSKTKWGKVNEKHMLLYYALYTRRLPSRVRTASASTHQIEFMCNNKVYFICMSRAGDTVCQPRLSREWMEHMVNLFIYKVFWEIFKSPVLSAFFVPVLRNFNKIDISVRTST